MDRPHWVSDVAWMRLEPVLAGQPLLARDVMDDLEAVTAAWTPELRCVLLERVARFGERGVALPSATMLALGELLGDAG